MIQSTSASARTRITVRAAKLFAVGAFAMTLSACGGGGVPTCSEFAQMAPDTSLTSSFTEEQLNALDASLKAEGYQEGGLNRTIHRGEVLAYCNISDGAANANADQPITEAHL